MKRNIEAQHQSIHDRIAALYDYCHGNSSNLDCRNCTRPHHTENTCLKYVASEMRGILKDVADHFQYEVECMRLSNFHLTNVDLFDAHLQDHDDIIRKCDALAKNSSNLSASSIIKSLLMDLLSWIEHHISIHDQRFIALLPA